MIRQAKETQENMQINRKGRKNHGLKLVMKYWFDKSEITNLVEVKRSKITAERQGYRIARNASQFRKLPVHVKGKAESDDDTKDVKEQQQCRTPVREKSQTIPYEQPIDSDIISQFNDYQDGR